MTVKIVTMGIVCPGGNMNGIGYSCRSPPSHYPL